VYPRNFDYYRPSSFPEAKDLMRQYGTDARLLAGGQSLIPLMKLRLAQPAVLIDLNGIPDLSYVRSFSDGLAIGALTRHSEVEDADMVGGDFELIRDAVRDIGDAQVRNLGTIGGSLVHADPSGDWGPVLLALGGAVLCSGTAGDRWIEAEDFFTDMYETARDATEIVTEVRMGQKRSGGAGAYLKLERRSGDFAVVGVAVHLILDDDDVCRDIGIGLSGVASTYVKAAGAEDVLRGSVLEEAALAEAENRLGAEVDPYSDVRGPSEYKRAMAKAFFRQAQEVARKRALRAREA